MKPWIIGMTGASGIRFASRLIQVLNQTGRRVHLVISEPARLTMKEELGIVLPSLSAQDFAEAFQISNPALIETHHPKEFTAPIASGSYPVEGMVIIPCSMGTLGSVANGLSQNLIHRAADCIIKENRRLILVPRETPFSAIHLENMLKLARLGVRIVPPIPGFYSGEKTIEDIIDFVVGKVMDQMEIPHALYPRWIGPAKAQSSKISKADPA